MSSRFVRKVRTASGALAVRLVSKQAGRVVVVEHVGSAHTDAVLGLVLEVVDVRLHSGKDAPELGPVRRDSTRWTGFWTERAGIGSLSSGCRITPGGRDSTPGVGMWGPRARWCCGRR